MQICKWSDQGAMKRRDVNNGRRRHDFFDDRRQIFESRFSTPNFGVAGKRGGQQALICQRLEP